MGARRSPAFYFEKLRKFLEGETIYPIGEYVDRKTRMGFHCTECCSDFTALITDIYGGSRCTHCNGKNLTKKSIQVKLDKLGKQITVLTDYVDALAHMDVQCEVCEYEWTSTFSNLKKNGCPACNKKARWSAESFRETVESNKNIKVIGEYKNPKTPIECECGSCGLLWKSHPTTLLGTGGCPSCARTGFDPLKPGYLYYLKVCAEDRTYWKIGITNNSISQRFHAIVDREKIIPLYCQYFEDGATAQLAEKNILEMFKEYRAKDVNILKLSGNRELFTKDVLQMDHLANRGLDDWPLYHLKI